MKIVLPISKKACTKCLISVNTGRKKMKVPIPLGGIAISRSLDNSLRLKIDGLVKKSLNMLLPGILLLLIM